VRRYAGWQVAIALAASLAAGCSPVHGGTRPGAQFQLLNAHWLLCPSQTETLVKCCPQPSDPRRCVVPNVAGNPGSLGSAPTELVAFGRFKNAGVAGGAIAIFSSRGLPPAHCSAALPFTPAGGVTEAWCTLGSAPEEGAVPDVTLEPRL
jgi:hypothetical protein